MEAIQQEILNKTTNVVDKLQKSINDIQIKCLKCSIKCCENSNLPMLDNQNCQRNCMIPLQNLQNEVEEELISFNVSSSSLSPSKNR
ncbi:hypothetical protein A3Q56_06418, partial [Intoshia linei]